MQTVLFGSTGQTVKNAQTALNYHLPAFAPLVVDGIFGNETRTRTIEFQKKFKLQKIDGIVGPETSKALYCFVQLSHHLLMPQFVLKRPTFLARSALVGDGQPITPSLPPMPPLRLNFPEPFRAPLPVPNLTLDPETLRLFRQMKFELEVGKERTFEKTLGSNEPVKAQTQIFADLKTTAWSRPFSFLGKEDSIDFSAGAGTILEKRIRPEGEKAETSVYIFVKAEWTPLPKLGPLQIAKIEAEAKITDKLKGDEPMDFSANLTVGPEVELFDGALTFGPGAYLEYGTNFRHHTLKCGLQATGTYHF
jgi:hypothetical protein